MLKNLNIRAKVLLIFVPVILLLAAQATLVLVVVGQMSDDVREVGQRRIEAVLVINTFMQQLSANQQRYQLLASQDDPSIPFEDIVYEVFEAEDRLQAQIGELARLVGSDAGSNDEGKALLERLITELERYNVANRTVTETFSLYNEIEVTTQHLLDLERTAMRESITGLGDQAVRLTQSVVIAGAATVIISLGLALWFGTTMRRPVRSVANGLRLMAEGDGDLTARLAADSHDEVGEVAARFNDFSEMLAGMMRDLKQSVNALAESGEALAANAEESAASINQINSSVQSVGELVDRENESVQSSTSAVEEISRNIDNLNNMIENQSSSVAQATASIEQMVANVRSVSERASKVEEAMKTLQETAGNGRDRMDLVSKEIEQVAGKSDLLLDTNKILANIAAQTNLLSMNAAIEAAHAGDAGAGFAVVAQEIRKLAEEASSQSKAIAESLKDVKGSIDRIVDSAREADTTFGQVREFVQQASRLQSELSSAMQEQAAGGQQVLEGLSRINEITGQVRTGAEEMQTGSQSVASEMNRLRESSEQVERAMREIASGTSEIEKGVAELQSTSQENQEIVQRLAAGAGRFKT